jgi:peptidoglycan-associated lipoprotein
MLMTAVLQDGIESMPNRREQEEATMAGWTRAVGLVLGSLAVALALGGCAGRSWQFWKSSSAEAPATTPTQVAATDDHAAPAPTLTAHPVGAPEPVATTARQGDGFVEVPVLADVRFRPGLVTVGRADARALDAVAAWLLENPGSQVRIEGHTDDLGSPSDNMVVGQRRAESAMKYLVAKGLAVGRISVVSYGSDHPLCVEKTKACRARNRRIHFLVKQ